MIIEGYLAIKPKTPAVYRGISRQQFIIHIMAFNNKPLTAADTFVIQKIVERLPVRFLEKGIINGIELHSPKRMEMYGGGAYLCGGRIIEITKDYNFPNNLAHEIGEAIYEHGLEPWERERFRVFLPANDLNKPHQQFANYVELLLCGKVVFYKDWIISEFARKFVSQLIAQT